VCGLECDDKGLNFNTSRNRREGGVGRVQHVRVYIYAYMHIYGECHDEGRSFNI